MASGLFPPPVGSAQWWSMPERYSISGDPDTDTARTVQIMCDQIKKGADDPAVREAAFRAMQQFGGRDALSLAWAAWYWCKTYIRLVHHKFLLRRHLGESDHLQGLISPDALVRMPRPEGDCAIFTSCLCSFLRIFGVPYEIVTLKVNPREPYDYSHVYAYAVLQDGTRFPLDGSHGTEPGWQVPSRDILFQQNQTGSPAIQVWDSDGNRVPDRGSRFEGLGNYGLRGHRGLGDLTCLDYNDPSSCSQTDTTSSSADLCALYPASCTAGVPSSTVTPDTTVAGTPGYTVPSPGSAAWAGIAAQLIKGGMTLAQINAIQPGTVVSANGAILRQNPGYAVPAGGTSAAISSLTSSSMMPWLLGAVVIIGGVALVGGRR
jgi:hypothetical protein